MPKRALISVSDKTGVVDLAQQLVNQGVDIVSTGGTKKVIEEAGIHVTGISDVTGFPEILDGRVKTLHPNVHAGLLAERDEEKHLKQLVEQGVTPIDFVIVNLYPFKEAISKDEVTFNDAIENIDIGGPTMLRSAAKNHQDVTVVVDPADYERVVNSLKQDGEVPLELKQELAAKVFRHTAHYDALIAGFLTEQVGERFPETKTMTYERKQTLRYGENPHQQAAFYQEPFAAPSSLSQANQLHGKALSYNNIQDADTALSIIKDFDEPTAVAVKHMNPCGVGIGNTLFDAFTRAYAADPVSIFGGIVALNRVVDVDVAGKLSSIFLEIIIAPQFTEEALAILTKKKNIRLLEVPIEMNEPLEQVRSVSGGVLIQDEDRHVLDETDLKVVTDRELTEAEWNDLRFAWKVIKHVKSNAILLAKDSQTIGVGAGQMNRVGSAKIAAEQAGDKAKGAVMASDAFFPMSDTVEAAHEAGVRAIIQPGGSIRDDDSIHKCNELGIAMVFTGVRHFKH
ncbi:bifunctional phosphoribosylaminoimidazolecarboxamide formyltransferase/IMP cyclohydrolase [Tenuibacillus multivorans]|uniref:Bifunctional purine biosynthesis protein PurH n=1 Tax=Tenuibacillus multivorans TaxID=237069 RepID=A0A1H0F935_9BACI|nr:bifunctional phosphoribosylaminoimidazolecarboxamide formyltransferase/IMP cyclohydrolase [Tenuibacillus multivorans]GEL78025.1 bifunctional purine biosynthesis protein PurH [Tenuibacillus multivorans]SDN91115.1 phosphoribosylaminoimidazolecarboxamide formyltransferase / IMP cyclohydrolase [Tenuibacillus multivorans]